MKTKKNIDRLFQERFKDFETEPNEHTWSNIQAALKKKKEQKIVPLWIKYAGIAAAFFLGFFTLNTIFKTAEDSRNSIVLENNPLNTSTTENDSIPTSPEEHKKNIHLKNNPKVALTDHKKLQKTNEKKIPNPVQIKTTAVATKQQNTIPVYLKKNNLSLKHNESKNEISKPVLQIPENSLKNPDSSEIVLNQIAKNELMIETKNSAIAKKVSAKQHLIAPADELQLVLKT
jgi:hypothetical protein